MKRFLAENPLHEVSVGGLGDQTGLLGALRLPKGGRRRTSAGAWQYRSQQAAHRTRWHVNGILLYLALRNRSSPFSHTDWDFSEVRVARAKFSIQLCVGSMWP